MRLIIQTPQGNETDIRGVQAVRFTLADGKPLTILPRHAPLMAELGSAPIRAMQSGTEHIFSPEGGILLVNEDIVKIIAEKMIMNGRQDA